jgi:hypothetical protein
VREKREEVTSTPRGTVFQREASAMQWKTERLFDIRLVLILSVLLLLCESVSFAGERLSLTIPPEAVTRGERIASFTITVHHAWVMSLPKVPKAWSICIKNDPAWKTIVDGGITVGVGAVYVDFFDNFIVLEKFDSGTMFDVNVELITLDQERRILLKMKDLVLKTVGK